MAYTAHLGVNRQLTVSNQGSQTVLSLIASDPGQQQSQTSSFTTGIWHTAPRLYQIETSFMLQINSQNGTHYILIQGNSLRTVTNPTLDNAVPVGLQDIPDPQPDTSGFGSMPPMQPMKMGKMSMDLNSMSMQMGNMSLQINNKKARTTKQRFCSQCGTAVPSNARFCGNCGHKLDS